MKDKDHPIVHPRGHRGDRTSAQMRGSCTRPDREFGRGRAPVLGWSDPPFAHGSVPKRRLGSLQPNKKLLSVRSDKLGEAGEEGRNYLLQVRLHQLLHLVMRISLWKSQEINDTGMGKVTQKKTLEWAGATPLLTAFSRPKFCGVAPARHRGTVTVFCPRAGVGESKL
jgi:hypothetical protein